MQAIVLITQDQSPHLSKERRQSQEQASVEAGLPATEESGNVPFFFSSQLLESVKRRLNVTFAERGCESVSSGVQGTGAGHSTGQ